jgi:hypothetical protein
LLSGLFHNVVVLSGLFTYLSADCS